MRTGERSSFCYLGSGGASFMTETVTQKRVYVCHGLTCVQRVRPIWNALAIGVQAQGLADACELIVSGCQSRCDYAPNINVYPQLTKYVQMTPEKVQRIIAEHLAHNQPVREWTFEEGV